MLSGIGVEQLKEGKTPRAGLLASALAFVTGFSVVFISFGASASAVGSFLLRNRASLAPDRRRADRPLRSAPHRPACENFRARRIAHRFRVRRCWNRAQPPCRPSPRVAEAHTLHRHRPDFSARSVAHPLAQSRRSFSESRRTTRSRERLPDGFRLRLRLDALHRPNSRERSRGRGHARHGLAGNFSAGGLFCRTRDPVSRHRARHRRLPALLSKVSPPLCTPSKFSAVSCCSPSAAWYF